MGTFYQLKVINVKTETQDSVVISFDIPNHLYDTFNYKSGQYLTLKFDLEGKEVIRSYSLCSSPVPQKPLCIGVKRVEEGLVSNHINDTIKVGSVVEVKPPEGHFYADVRRGNYKTYYLFTAGSGITPILSILRSVLLEEEKSYVYMIYGNRNHDSIMFKTELSQLQEQFGNRLVIKHCLSKPKSSFWSNKQQTPYIKGRIDKKIVKWFLDEYPSYAQNTEYYICGPESMINDTELALLSFDVPEGRIFKESFGSINTGSISVETVANAKLTATLHNENVEISIEEGKTVLRALIDNNYNPPYSCEGGICASCICKLKKGKVHMVNTISLTDEQIEQNYILSCQSIPLTDEIVVEYN
ncbi:MAG: hypothetical protein BM557_07825 [Flavobacterium sp. MedPE-SWcel]|uniref:ferredoxin--NADP reductase n=1 Tax=uncultured Flavobacterium sp. TaxID=165435 RepID=UPI0009137A35|nr:ferredoxin--NADP reductase [uncultured Flavobacterium sp.]OIQ18114.1 MAG: hypothetical protein BM557_07825 [Flavobacterium sp. MedPE-SWcel]